MKYFLVLLFLSPVYTYSQKSYTINQAAYSWFIYGQGLPLHAGPGDQAPVITTIPYAAPVTIIDPMKGKYKDTDTLSKDPDQPDYPLVIEGGWVKVLYAKDTGYVFDGYLSRIPVMNLSEFYKDAALIPSAAAYRHIKEKKEPYIQKFIKEDGSKLISVYKDGRQQYTYDIKQISFEEAVMLLQEEMGEHEEGCPFTLKEIKGKNYYFESCRLTIDRRILKKGKGIRLYIFQ